MSQQESAIFKPSTSEQKLLTVDETLSDLQVFASEVASLCFKDTEKLDELRLQKAKEHARGCGCRRCWQEYHQLENQVNIINPHLENK